MKNWVTDNPRRNDVMYQKVTDTALICPNTAENTHNLYRRDWRERGGARQFRAILAFFQSNMAFKSLKWQAKVT